MFLALLFLSNALVKSRIKPVPKRAHIMDFLSPMREPPFLLLSLACFFFAMAVYLPATFIILDSISKGVDTNLASYLLAILNAVR